jgi:integrase
MGKIKEELSHSSESNKRVSSATKSICLRNFAKTDVRYWRERILKPRYSLDGHGHETPNWAVEIQHRGRRHRLSLGTPNREAAASLARDMFLLVHAQGWEAALAHYRPLLAPKRTDITIGEFLTEISAKADKDLKTIDGYARALRTIVSDVFDLDIGNRKFDYRNGGNQAWVNAVHDVKLGRFTPDKVQAWKRSFLAAAGTDSLKQRKARVSVNSLLRRARCLFSAAILRNLSGIELPSPLPFEGVALEAKVSRRYHSEIDVGDLIRAAHEELAVTETEAFKVFLLALMAGLRRKEIDLLEWSSFQWQTGVVRIAPTRYFHPKTEDSIGDVPLDSEVVELFRGFRPRSTGTFVIESRTPPRPGARYFHYRCQSVFETLAGWLRAHGVTGNKPLHTLRKEFGTQLANAHGIHAASKALRHSDIAVTNAVYLDAGNRVRAGLGRYLAVEREVRQEEKVIPIRTRESVG